MTTSTIVWIVVIALVALVLIGLIAASMRKKSRADNEARASELRDQADTQAASLPDTQARADQADARAETARLDAERAEEHAASIRAEADQQRAVHEDQIRAADRLDPGVDHRAKDYSPQVSDPAGPSNIPAGTAPQAAAATDTSQTAAPSTEQTAASAAGPTGTHAGSSVTLEPTDTSPRDESIGSDPDSLRDRLDGGSAEGTVADPDETSGAHRA